MIYQPIIKLYTSYTYIYICSIKGDIYMLNHYKYHYKLSFLSHLLFNLYAHLCLSLHLLFREIRIKEVIHVDYIINVDINIYVINKFLYIYIRKFEYILQQLMTFGQWAQQGKHRVFLLWLNAFSDKCAICYSTFLLEWIIHIFYIYIYTLYILMQ